MPFQKIYAVDFRIGPHPNPIFNPFIWPSLQILPNSAERDHQWCPAGLDLKITRDASTPHEVRNSVYVTPPGGIPINSRLLLKVTFLHPNAIGLPNVLAEPWAIGLRFSTENNILDATKSAIATCQFQRINQILSVRLNTPEGEQKDQAVALESLINYSVYNPVPPNSVINPDIVPIFTLEHSFSGFNLLNVDYTLSTGFLKLSRLNISEVTDHRLNLRKAFANPSDKIRAIGVNLATNNGFGTMSVRLLTLEIWRDIGSPII